MRRVLIWVGAVVALLGLALVGAVVHFRSAAAAILAKKHDVAVEAIPIPFPLSRAEREAVARRLAPVATAGAEGDATPAPGAAAAPVTEPASAELTAAVRAEAKRVSVERGRRYLESRAGCADCHGADLGGKVIIDAFPMGKWVAPNITSGGLTAKYRPEDWVRIIRHGVKPDGTAATMPSRDFTWFSDQEVSDIASYIQSLPPVDRVMPNSELGPVFVMLIATGKFPIDADQLDHNTKRLRVPPPLVLSQELGAHLAATCRGCHGADYGGGPIMGGDPSWPPAANLTNHATGLAGWTLEQFTKALRSGERPDGKKLHPAMPIGLTAKYADVEVASLFQYLQAAPPVDRSSKK